MKQSKLSSDNLIIISIIIPVFNDDMGLLATLSALSKQTYAREKFEVVVVDNGSKNKINLAKSYPFRCTVVEEKTPGSYAARNMGIKFAQGHLIAFIDANCLPTIHWLESGVQALTDNKSKYGILGGKVTLFCTKNKSSWASFYDIYTGFGQEENVKNRKFAATANLFVSKKVIRTIGLFNVNLLSGGDLEWCWRGHLAGLNVGYLAAAEVFHPARNSLSSLIKQSRRVEGGRRTLRRVFEIDDNKLDQSAIKARNPIRIIFNVLKDQNLGLREKIIVVSVASVNRIAVLIEKMRLSFGSVEERE